MSLPNYIVLRSPCVIWVISYFTWVAFCIRQLPSNGLIGFANQLFSTKVGPRQMNGSNLRYVRNYRKNSVAVFAIQSNSLPTKGLKKNNTKTRSFVEMTFNSFIFAHYYVLQQSNYLRCDNNPILWSVFLIREPNRKI